MSNDIIIFAQESGFLPNEEENIYDDIISIGEYASIPESSDDEFKKIFITENESKFDAWKSDHRILTSDKFWNGKLPSLSRITCFSEAVFQYCLTLFPEDKVFQIFSKKCNILIPYYAGLMKNTPKYNDIKIEEYLKIPQTEILKVEDIPTNGPHNHNSVHCIYNYAINLNDNDFNKFIIYCPYRCLIPIIQKNRTKLNHQ